MNSLNNVPTAEYREGRVYVSLPNGVSFSFPIMGNWRLEEATLEQLENMEVDESGIYWPDVDEDLSFEGLLRGDYGQFVRKPHVVH